MVRITRQMVVIGGFHCDLLVIVMMRRWWCKLTSSWGRLLQQSFVSPPSSWDWLVGERGHISGRRTIFVLRIETHWDWSVGSRESIYQIAANFEAKKTKRGQGTKKWMIRAQVNTCMGVRMDQRVFVLTWSWHAVYLYLTCFTPPYLMHPPVLDMFAGIGDPILPADHMVNRPKLAATHLALNFTISPGISSSHHPKYSETLPYGTYSKSSS